MKRTLLTTILYVCTVLCVSAQSVSHVRHFTIREGLPANYIVAIDQDSEGRMWIATWNGLVCYDGYQFTTFQDNSQSNIDQLSTNRIAKIKTDSQGHVWVRTHDGGLYLFDTRTCRFTNIKQRLLDRYGLEILPRNFYATPSGHTWITDEHKRLNLRIDDRYPTDLDRMEVTDCRKLDFGQYIRKIETDRKGREWIITDVGIMRYGSNERHRGVFDIPGSVPQPERPADVYVRQNAINRYFIDRQANLWFNKEGGLSLVNFQKPLLQLVSTASSHQTRAVLCRQNGELWAGTIDGYVCIYRHGTLAGWLSPQGRVSSSRQRFADHVYDLKEDSQGRLWIGTKGEGLYLLAADGTLTGHYTHSADPYSLSSDRIYDIDEDERGNIIIATYGGGVNIVKREALETGGAALQFLHSGNGLKNYPKEFCEVRRVTHDGHGNIILSTTSGLVTFSNSINQPSTIKFYTSAHQPGDSTSLRTSDVMQTLVCRNGHIYVVTMGGAIQQLTSDRLLQDNLTFSQAGRLNHGNGTALSLVEDRQGRIWVFRESEINAYDPQKGTLQQYAATDSTGLIGITEAKPAIDDKGRIWMGAVGNVITFDSEKMQKSQYCPNIVFTAVRFQGERQTRPILNNPLLTVGKDQRNLTISFAALDYHDNYLMEYAYRMDDNPHWNYIGSNPRIAFSQLAPGKHRLTVRSTNSDGVWMDNEATITLDVEPYVWERLWVQLLALLLVIGLSTWAVITWLAHRQHSREREQRLESIMRQYQQLLDQQSAADSQPSTAVSEQPAVREYKLAEPEIVDPDEQMMTRLMAFIEKHISDEELRIEDMADAVGMGRTVFYEKIRQLVGVSPSDFLRQVRMQRAQQLLTKSSMTVSEVAYNIGFTDPKYFTKCFKKQTGLTPSEYREQTKETDNKRGHAITV